MNAAAAYLRGQPALDRVLRQAEQKYISLGHIGGLVLLENDEEAFAIRGLRCKIRSDHRVSLAELDQALRERTRFRSGLVETLEAYLGRPLVTRRQAAASEVEAWHAARAEIRSLAPASAADQWLERDEPYLWSQWRARPQRFRRDVAIALRAGAELPRPEGGLEVPVLAFRVTGDAHALDPDRPSGRYFERLLLSMHPGVGLAPPLGAEDRETLYALAGLSVDELSSTVLVAGLKSDAELLSAARRHGSILALPLRTLYEVIPTLPLTQDNVFAIENPSVLSAIHRALQAYPPEHWPPLVCTSGHLSLAGLRLLDALVARGARIHYSGDFDVKGLLIARALACRFGGAFHPWRFDVQAYAEALQVRHEHEFHDPAPIHSHDAGFADLAASVARDGAAYQEGLIDGLIRDVLGRVGE